jgi:hypothetical protein
VEYIHFFKIVTQIFSFIGTQDAKGEAQKSPQMNGLPCMVIDITQIMDLGMTIVTWGNAIVCLGGQDLVCLGLPISPSFFGESGLEKTASAAAAKIVGLVGGHVDEVFFTHHGLDNVPEIIGNGISQCFSHQLAWILDSEFDLSVLVPVTAGFELSFLDPLCVELDDAQDFKFMLDVEFFQSCQDCE